MIVTWDVCGFFDWEDAAKLGATVTEADVRAGRARPMMNGAYGVRVEKSKDTHHDMAIPELVICQMIAQRAAAGKRVTREEAVSERIREQTFRHHIARRHVKSVVVHDSGCDAELMRWALAALRVEGRGADDAMSDYLDDVDMQASLFAQFGPLAKKGSK